MWRNKIRMHSHTGHRQGGKHSWGKRSMTRSPPCSLHAPTGMCGCGSGWWWVERRECCFRGRTPFFLENLKRNPPLLSPSPTPPARRQTCYLVMGCGPWPLRPKQRQASRRLATQLVFMSRAFLISSQMGDCISKTCAYQLTTHTHLCMHTRMRRLSRDQLEADMGQCDRPPPFQTSVWLW